MLLKGPPSMGRAVSAAVLASAGAVVAAPLSGTETSRPFTVTAADALSATVALDAAMIRGMAAGAGTFTLEQFPLSADVTVDLQLQRFRVTTPGTRFVVGHAGAGDTEWAFDPDRVTLLRGRVIGEPGSHVFMALSEWGNSGRIELGSGSGFALVAGENAQTTVSRAGDAGHAGHAGALSPDVPFCGAPTPGNWTPTAPLTAFAGGLPEITQQIEIALETDFELFELFGDLDATAAYMVQLWGAVGDIFLRDVNTRVMVTFVRLWDDPDDLFNAEDPFSDFVNHWQEFMTEVPRDVAQFVSGRRNMPYGGIAFLTVLCSDFAYGLVGYIIGHFTDPDIPGVFGYDVQVTAHELGHNAGTPHTHDLGLDTCNNVTGIPQRGTIMSYCSQTRSGANGNTDLRFHVVTAQEMRNHIFSVDTSCLVDDCNGNGVDDATDIAIGTSLDLNANGIADECEDCNRNGVLDPSDIALGTSLDQNFNGIPDECEPDCNGNGVPDDRDILLGVDTDLYGNFIPDGCEVDCNGNGTSDYTEIQADMTLDLDRNAMLDSCQDCDDDGVTDFDALAGAHNAWVASTEAGSKLGEYHARAGVKMNESTGGSLNNLQDLIITADGRILVSSAGNDSVLEFAADGTYVGDLVSSGSGGLNFAAGLVISPGGSLLVAGWLSHSVFEYDAVSGAPLGTFVPAGSGGLINPWGLAFGPDGNLFVSSLDGSIIEYDGQTGALIGPFVTTGDNGGLIDPHGLLFKPDGNLLVASTLTDQILEYDGLTGAFIDQFNHGGTATVLTMDQPWTLRLAPDGDVYASRHGVSVAQETARNSHAHHDDDDIAELHINSTRIYIFDVDSGNFVRSYVTGHDTGLSFPGGFDFMPGDATDCNVNLLPDSCDIASGFSADVNGNGIPDECETLCPGDLDGDGVVGITDFLALLAAWGPNPGHPGDLDGDDVVGITDFLALLGNWGACP